MIAGLTFTYGEKVFPLLMDRESIKFSFSIIKFSFQNRQTFFATSLQFLSLSSDNLKLN